MSEEPLPEWFIPPPEGWTADDLDRLPPEAPKHVELIDGAFIVPGSQTRFHCRVTRRLADALESAAVGRAGVASRMTVTLGRRQRFEPDVVVHRLDVDGGLDRRTFVPEEVLLVVEVVSDDSDVRDRKTKPQRYAEAGIRHLWRVEQEDRGPVVYVLELEDTTGAYVGTGIFRDRVKLAVPFPMDIDVKALAR